MYKTDISLIECITSLTWFTAILLYSLLQTGARIQPNYAVLGMYIEFPILHSVSCERLSKPRLCDW